MCNFGISKLLRTGFIAYHIIVPIFKCVSHCCSVLIKSLTELSHSYTFTQNLLIFILILKVSFVKV